MTTPTPIRTMGPPDAEASLIMKVLCRATWTMMPTTINARPHNCGREGIIKLKSNLSLHICSHVDLCGLSLPQGNSSTKPIFIFMFTKQSHFTCILDEETKHWNDWWLLRMQPVGVIKCTIISFSLQLCIPGETEWKKKNTDPSRCCGSVCSLHGRWALFALSLMSGLRASPCWDCQFQYLIKSQTGTCWLIHEKNEGVIKGM